MALDVIFALASFAAVCAAWIAIERKRPVLSPVEKAEERAA
jgi:hypothetical protein